MLVLRTCRADMTSLYPFDSAKGAFTWPEFGPVKCSDWDSSPHCGHGLHGFAWGEGDGKIANFDVDAKWLVVEVDDDTVVPIDSNQKVKFPAGNVVYCGDRVGATQYILSHGAAGRAVIGADLIVGDNQGAIVGYRGTATAGNYGTATAGYRGTATAGNYGTATAGEGGTATAGYRGTATAGEGGTATAGEGGTATAGNYGTATAGYRGTATAGYRGTATAGYRGTATAGEGGILEIAWQEFLPNRGFSYRKRKTIAYVGENGILPNVAYKLTDAGLFVPVKPELITPPAAEVTPQVIVTQPAALPAAKQSLGRAKRKPAKTAGRKPDKPKSSRKPRAKAKARS